MADIVNTGWLLSVDDAYELAKRQILAEKATRLGIGDRDPQFTSVMREDVGKVGPHGYVHGWIKVGPGEGTSISEKKVPGGTRFTIRLKKPKGGEGGRDLEETQLKPGHVVRVSSGKHYAIIEKKSGYKFKNPAHPDGMREVVATPVGEDGSMDPAAEPKSLYFDRDSKVHVAGHVPGTAGERANNSGNPVTRRYQEF